MRRGKSISEAQLRKLVSSVRDQGVRNGIDGVSAGTRRGLERAFKVGGTSDPEDLHLDTQYLERRRGLFLLDLVDRIGLVQDHRQPREARDDGLQQFDSLAR
jgi:hypothetical protein